MRRIVRDFIAAAIDRARLDLERYVARHLDCPESFRVGLPAAGEKSDRIILTAATLQQEPLH